MNRLVISLVVKMAAFSLPSPLQAADKTSLSLKEQQLRWGDPVPLLLL